MGIFLQEQLSFFLYKLKQLIITLQHIIIQPLHVKKMPHSIDSDWPRK